MHRLSRLYSFLCLTLILVFSNLALADALQLDASQRHNLRSGLYYMEDPGGALTVTDLLADQAWQRNSDNEFSHGYSSSVWWFRLDIHNPLASSQQRLLELSYAILDYVDIYVVRNGQLAEDYQTGDMRPQHQRPANNPYFVTPLAWQPGDTLTVLYRIQSSSAIQAPVTLWTPEAFARHTSTNNLAHGIYYGAMVIIAVYNLLLYLLLRDRSYLYYVGFVLSNPLFFLAISGQGLQYLWPDLLYWNSVAIPFSVASLILFGALFTREFIRLKQVSPAFDRVIFTFAVIGATLLLLSLVLPYRTVLMILVPVSILACLTDFTAAATAWYRGVRSARFYVIAWSCFLLATILFSLQTVGVIPKHTLLDYSVQIGSVLEAVLLSFALVERINNERRLRFAAQADAIQTTTRLNLQLEKRVEERTAELAELNQRLERLSNTDELTGLYNRRYLDAIGITEWQRCARYQHSIAILLIDADHFKAINDRHGHSTGDRCLQLIAEHLSGKVRMASDVAARIGGEEFCVMLPETSREDALCVAERICADIHQHLVKVENQEVSLTVSIGVYCEIPGREDSFEHAFDCADQALYRSKQNGRNQVTLYEADMPPRSGTG